MLKGLTAQYLLRRTFPVKPGHTILFHAAAGGVGLIACQWAKHLGCTVIGTVGSRDKEALARENGCDHVILYREEDFVARVKEITAGAGCDVVYDGVGKATFPGSLDCLKPFGMFVSFGAASGPIEAFNIGLLAQKGSLYATRPTLFTHIAKRETLDAMARTSSRWSAGRAGQDPGPRPRAAAPGRRGPSGPRGRETTGATILSRRTAGTAGVVPAGPSSRCGDHQALRRSPRQRRHRSRDPAGRDPCAPRRERRRQVDPGEDPLRRGRARRRRDRLGRPAGRIASPVDARALGIGMVFQHFSLFDELTVAENIAVALSRGDPPTPSRAARREVSRLRPRARSRPRGLDALGRRAAAHRDRPLPAAGTRSS